MKYIIFCFGFCIIYVTIYAAYTPAREPVQIKVIDQYSQPITGVYVIHKTKNHLITTTDVSGDCSIPLEQFPAEDSIQFQGIGYAIETYCIADLYLVREIRLNELQYELPESTIKRTNTKDLLAKVCAKLKKEPKSLIPVCRYYGEAQYEKITACRDTVVEYRREYGYYFTSGDIKPKNNWDQNHRSYLVPSHTSRSYNMTIGNQDTLAPIYLTADDIRFDVGTRKIFTLMRTVQLFAPLFNGMEYYNIQPAETDNSDYAFTFETKKNAYPQDICMYCKGIFFIDCQRHELKSIIFDYIDYQLFRQTVMVDKCKANSPFSTKATITFAYNNQSCYIRSCQQTTTWKYNLGEQFILIEQPSRNHPGINKLIEEEAFYCYNYKPIPNNLQNNQMLVKIHLAHRYPKGKYDPELFHELPVLLDNRQAIADLNPYMELETQFKHHSDKTYYPDNYILGFAGNEQTRQLYQKDLQEVRTQLFELFSIPDCPQDMQSP